MKMVQNSCFYCEKISQYDIVTEICSNVVNLNVKLVHPRGLWDQYTAHRVGSLESLMKFLEGQKISCKQ
jgi:hypothetical protein